MSPAGGDPWAPAGRVQAGASARSWLLTILGELVLPAGGAAWTSQVIAGMQAVGIEEKASRQALARSADAGLLDAERRGRRTRWALTEEATRLLGDGARRIYAFGAVPAAWDGRWLVVLTSVPETDRHLRHRVRSRLGWYGFAALSGGVWVSPWVDREPDVAVALAAIGLAEASFSFVATAGVLGDLEARSSQVWDLAAVEDRYEGFVALTEATAPADDRAAFAALVTLVHRWRQFPAIDPGLPARLLPEPWRGQSASELFRERRSRWAAPARRWWAGL